MEVRFGHKAYKSRSLPFSAQECINCYVEAADGEARGRILVQGTEGLTAFADTGNNAIEGICKFGSDVYAVTDTRLKRITSAGAVSDIGVITGSGHADIACSDTYIVVVRDGKGWTYNGTTFAQITDADFLTPSSVIYLDGYFIFTKAASDTFFISALNDPTSYDGTEFAAAEAAPDNLVRVFEDHRDLFLFGEQTTEVWYNAGDVDFPFVRRQDAYLERGCLAPWSIAKDDNTVFWLGDDGLFYTMAGYTPKVISTDAIATAVEQMTAPEDAEGFCYTFDRHKFYVVTFPTDGVTYQFDTATGLWSQRQSFELGRWRSQNHVKAFGKNLVGDSQSGKLFELNPDVFTEDGGVLKRTVTSPPIHSGVNRLAMTRLDLVFESGVGLTTGQGSDPQVMLQWSDDGGRTWSDEHWRGIGKKGEYGDRARWFAMGQFRERVLRVEMTDPVRFALIHADAEIKVRRP